MNAMMRNIAVLSILVSVAPSFASDAAVKLTDDEVANVSRDVKGKIWATDQVAQEADHVVVFVTSDLRDVDHFCFATSTTLDVKHTKAGWTVERHDEATMASFQPCAGIKATSFAEIDGAIPEMKIAVALKVVQAISKGAGNPPISFSTPELSAYVDGRLIDHLYAISPRLPDGLVFQFAVKGLMPTLLGLRIEFEGDRVISVFVSPLNGFGVVKENRSDLAH